MFTGASMIIIVQIIVVVGGVCGSGGRVVI